MGNSGRDMDGGVVSLTAMAWLSSAGEIYWERDRQGVDLPWPLDLAKKDT